MTHAMKRNLSTTFALQYCFLTLLILFRVNTGNAQVLSNQDKKGTVYESLQIKSKLLGEDLKYSVYLPPDYQKSDIRFPVLYLLNGFGGDETSWIRMAHIQMLADSLINYHIIRPMILVMPDGQNSYFINDYKNAFPYEDFFIKEFIPFIDSLYRTLPEKNSRGIAGLSMGGYGAIILAVKHPDIFGYSIALSAALRTNETFENLSPDRYKNNFSRLFGDSLTGSERITRHWKENSPFYLVNAKTAEVLKNVQWYIDCGMHDPLLSGNETFHQLLLNLNIPHEYHMRIGNHNWNYWRREIPDGLIFFSENLSDKL